MVLGLNIGAAPTSPELLAWEPVVLALLIGLPLAGLLLALVDCVCAWRQHTEQRHRYDTLAGEPLYDPAGVICAAESLCEWAAIVRAVNGEVQS